MGITNRSTIPDIDQGLHEYALTVTRDAELDQSHRSGSRNVALAHTLGTSTTGRLRHPEEDPDLQFFAKLDGYNAATPQTWGLLENGLKNYHRLLQERTVAMTQACGP